MKIKDIRAIEVSQPVEGRTRPKRTNLIEITTDEGITGIGESRSSGIPLGIHSGLVENILKPLLIGCDPHDVEALYAKMYRATQNIGQQGLLIIEISGVELALWDLIGKNAKQPVYNLIGGCVNRDIEAYASLGRYPTVDEAVKGAQHYIDMGFNAIKWHQREIESSKALRREDENVKIMLDVNGLWTPAETIKKARELEDYNMTWLESPVYPQNDYDGMATVTAAVGEKVPICAGENGYTIWEFKHYMDKKSVNILNHDTVKCGGLWQAKKIAAMAEPERILCAPHSACDELGLETALHLTTSTPNCAYAEIWAAMRYVMDGVAQSLLVEPLKIDKKGFIQASDKPGYGVELDWDIVNKYTVNAK